MRSCGRQAAASTPDGRERREIEPDPWPQNYPDLAPLPVTVNESR